MTHAFRKPMYCIATILLAGGLAACGGGDAEVAAERPAKTVAAASDEPRFPPFQGGANLEYLMPSYGQAFMLSNPQGLPIGNGMMMDVQEGVALSLRLNIMPAGEHAVHFHEVGKCEGPDFKSAGGHYNPTGHNHGFESAAPNPHAGDMKNFEMPATAPHEVNLLNERVSISEREGFAPLFDADNTALIIHASADDYESQPSGAAGARIACAIIEPER